jgi:hypothetical protein
MSQTVFNTIDPSTTSGNQLAQILNDFKDAVMSGFIGNSRPTETVAGGYWIDNTSVGSGYLYYKVYTGTIDITVFTVDLNTGTISTAGTQNSYSVTKISADATGPLLKLIKKRIDNGGQVLNGDTLGEFQFVGTSDDANERISARIKTIAKNDFTSSTYGGAIVFEQVNTGGNTLSEKARLQDGKLGVGTTSPSTGVHVTNLDILNEKASDDALGAKSKIKKKRVAGTGQVQNNDVVGTHTFVSTDDTGLEIDVAEIEVKATQNHTSTAQGSKVTFRVKNTGSNTFTDKMTIDNSGVNVTDLNVTNLQATNVQMGTVVETQDAQLTVNKGGTQSTANSTPAGLKVEMSDATHAGLFYDSTTASKFKVGEVGTTKEIADISSSQNFTNKTLTGASVVTPSRLDVKQDTKSNLQTYALTATNGQLVFATDTKEYFAVKDAALVDVGGGVGGVNYITNYDAKNDTTGWAVYADAAATRPVDGTGGSANVTWTRTTTNPLAGTASFLFTKDAVNRQGQGASYSFTIDAMSKAKVLNIEFDYIIDSGTFTAGTRTTDSDIIVYIYDVTNATLIEPSSIKLLSNSTSIPDHFIGTFQTSSNSTSYRLIFHCASTSASAFAVKIDNVFVSPSEYLFGTPITDWQAYTPTLGPGYGTVTELKAYWRRVGNELQAMGSFRNGTLATNTGEISIPSGLSIDSTYFRASQSNILGFGSGFRRIINAGGANTDLIYRIGFDGTILNKLWLTSSSSGDTAGGTFTKTNVNSAFNNSDVISFFYQIPILGWSSSVQMSDSADTRVVAASYYKNATQAITANTTNITFPNKRSDTHGAFDGTTFTAPVSGYYIITGGGISPTTASGILFTAYINGTISIALGSSNSNGGDNASFSGMVYLNAGDLLTFRGNSSVTMSAAGDLQIHRVSGPSAIAASELVAASYWLSANFAASTTTPINFDSKEFDSHGAVTTSATAWKFTAPISGTYELNIFCFWGAVAAGTFIYKNGVLYKPITYQTTGASASGCTFIKLNIGDYIDIRPGTGNTAQGGILSSINTSNISISRVGY